ncbi:phage holin family protein [Psychroflexus sp. ALD_RP9]|uniref:phage holin family protein n=1 Tax=Psychroflexus sp. ALD_RP9 TaxID=2777186 RepID=UPI001A8D952F|nr:phage holin family protein [Psychroflexus sp. ALD_RP9]QSS96234.1 phage holin family protein [Psychroflexus sp. ALD_RP9]
MKLILRLLVSAIMVVVLANILPGVYVGGFLEAIVLAVVLALLNMFVKPILIVFTLPVTIISFGLFLLVINALIILLADSLVSGFRVDGFWYALIFSLLLSILQAITFKLAEKDQA